MQKYRIWNYNEMLIQVMLHKCMHNYNMYKFYKVLRVPKY